MGSGIFDHFLRGKGFSSLTDEEESTSCQGLVMCSSRFLCSLYQDMLCSLALDKSRFRVAAFQLYDIDEIHFFVETGSQRRIFRSVVIFISLPLWCLAATLLSMPVGEL